MRLGVSVLSFLATGVGAGVVGAGVVGAGDEVSSLPLLLVPEKILFLSSRKAGADKRLHFETLFETCWQSLELG